MSLFTHEEIVVLFATPNLWSEMLQGIEDESPTQFVEDELVGFSCVVRKDYEVEKDSSGYEPDEHGYPVWVKDTDDGASVDQPYFTRSGDNPVLVDQATLLDEKRSAGGVLDFQAPNKQYYSSFKWSQEDRLELRRFIQSVVWVCKHQDKPATLREGWIRFWKRVYADKTFMTDNHIKLMKRLFGRYGVRSMNSKPTPNHFLQMLNLK